MAVILVYIPSSSVLYASLPSVKAASLLYSAESVSLTVYIPSFCNALSPLESLATSEKSLSLPDSLELIKNLALFSSKLALTPASFNLDTNWLTFISDVISILLVPEAVLKLIEPSVVPTMSDILVSPVILLPSAALICPPVRYPVDASCLTLSLCVPLTADELAVTLEYLSLDTLDVFRL